MSEREAKRLLGWLWKVPACAAAFLAGGAVGGLLAGAVGLEASLPPGADARQLGRLAAPASLLLPLGLAAVGAGLRTRFWGRWLVLGGFVYAVMGPATGLEAELFTTFGDFAFTAVTMLPPAVLLGAAVALLFRPERTEGGLGEAFRGLFGRHGVGSWVIRLAAAVLAFPVVYFTFGGMISPFVVDVYEQGTAGLRLPGLGSIAAVQLVRSAVFLAVSLPVIAAWSGRRLRLWLALGWAHFVFSGLFGMVVGVWMPLRLRLVHGAEMLADSMAYAGLLVVLLVGTGGAGDEGK